MTDNYLPDQQRALRRAEALAWEIERSSLFPTYIEVVLARWHLGSSNHQRQKLQEHLTSPEM